jgi:predicted AAA+ superfamily ATPase
MHEGSQVLADPEKRGRIFEAAVGARLFQMPGNLYYWREKQDEVDFVYTYQGRLYAVEIKSGRRKLSRGLNTFMDKFPKACPVIITQDNFDVFSENPRKFFDDLAFK